MSDIVIPPDPVPDPPEPLAGGETEVLVATDLRPSGGRSVFLATPFGFNAPGRHYLSTVLVPALVEADLDPVDPWEGNDELFAPTLQMPDGPERLIAMTEANASIGARNLQLIEACDAVLALLDGADVNSGTAAQIGYACARGKPVVGLRTDTRESGDNDASMVNLQVQHCVAASGGSVTVTLEGALADLARLLGA